MLRLVYVSFIIVSLAKFKLQTYRQTNIDRAGRSRSDRGGGWVKFFIVIAVLDTNIKSVYYL